MTAPYQPEIGHRIRGTVEGVVEDVAPWWTKVAGTVRVNGGITWERLPDPEPEWQPGDVVRDASGDVFVRSSDDGLWWYGPDRKSDEYLARPLTRLVPEATS